MIHGHVNRQSWTSPRPALYRRATIGHDGHAARVTSEHGIARGIALELNAGLGVAKVEVKRAAVGCRRETVDGTDASVGTECNAIAIVIGRRHRDILGNGSTGKHRSAERNERRLHVPAWWDLP